MKNDAVSKKLLYQSIPLGMDNFCTKFQDVTISSSKVIEGGGAESSRFFYLQKSPILLGLRKTVTFYLFRLSEPIYWTRDSIFIPHNQDFCVAE